MKQNLHTSIKLSILVLILTTFACGSGAPTPAANDVSTIVAGTLAVLQPSATTPSTAVPLPTSTLAPSPIPPSPVPPASNLPPAARISFATGATQSATEGSIPTSQPIYYVVRALKGQPMMVDLGSPNNNAKLSIFGANGVVLLPAAQQTSSWQGILPATQDYYFGITGTATSDFLLNVVIPARIQFAAGQNQITLTGQTAGGYGVAYVAYALGGQKMDVSINTDPNTAALTIWGFSDGQPYARAQNGVVDFSLVLPSTQDYIIEAVPQGGQVVNYTVKLKIK